MHHWAGTAAMIIAMLRNPNSPPSAKGKNAKGAEIDFSAPAFIEDFGVIEAVRDAYQGKLTLVSTMLQAAQAKRADDGGCRQVRSRLHSGLRARRDHPRRRRGDAARFRQGIAAG